MTKNSKYDFPDVPRIYVDMDGPLADFDRSCRELGIQPKEAKSRPGFFANLPLTHNAQYAMSLMEDFPVQLWILTKIPDGCPQAATEKYQWAAKHFPNIENRIILSVDKGCVGTARDFLIDDHVDWANCKGFPGTLFEWRERENTGNNWISIVIKVKNILKERNV